MKALVLAAGLGTRLGALTADKPKAMLPLEGEPLLAHTLRYLAAHGVDDVVVNVHHHGHLLEGYFDDGSAHGVRLHWRREAQLLGTAGTLASLKDHFKGESAVLVLYGDLLLDQDLRVLIETHRRQGADGTLLVHRRKGSNSALRVEPDGDSLRITAFLERPTAEEAQQVSDPWVNSGVAVIGRTMLEALPTHAPADLPRDVYAPNVTRYRLAAVPLTGYRCAIDSPARYAEAEAALREGRCRRF